MNFYIVFIAFVAICMSGAVGESPDDTLLGGRKVAPQGRTPGHVNSHQPHWTSFVGQVGSNAAKAIKLERPELEVHIIEEGSMVTMDMRPDRVRVYIDSTGKVTKVPRIG